MMLGGLFKETTAKKRMKENKRLKKLIVIILVIERNITYSPMIHGKYGSTILRLWAPLQISLYNGKDCKSYIYINIKSVFKYTCITFWYQHTLPGFQM